MLLRAAFGNKRSWKVFCGLIIASEQMEYWKGILYELRKFDSEE